MRHRTNHHDAPCEHDHGGNDINDNDIDRARHHNYDRRGVYNDDPARNDHDVAGDDNDVYLRTRLNLGAFDDAIDEYNDWANDDERPFDDHLAAVRAVYDTAAAVLDIADHNDHASYDDAGNVIDHDNIRAAIVDVNNARGTYDYLPAVDALVDTATAVLGIAQHDTTDLDRLRAAFIDACAMHRSGDFTEYDAARDALCAALRD